LNRYSQARSWAYCSAALVLLALPVSGTSSRVQVSGAVNVTYECGAAPRTHVSLTTANGSLLPVSIPNGLLPEGGLPELAGRTVHLQGTASKEGVTADVISLDSSEAAVKRGIGRKKHVTILLKFADTTDRTPFDQDYVKRFFGSPDIGVDHWYREASNGLMSIDGTTVIGWLTLPKSEAGYRSGGQFNFDLALADGIAKADSQLNYPQFDAIHLCFNSAFGNGVAGLGGTRTLQLDGQVKTYGVSWHSAPGEESTLGLGTWVHEIGHGLGWPHSSGPYQSTYDSRWDVMRMSVSYGGISEEFGYVGAGTISYHKQLAGWIPKARRYVAKNRSNQTITLERLNKPGSDGYLMAQIPVGKSKKVYYTVEARKFVGYDELVPAEGVIIHNVVKSRPDRDAQVVDADRNGDCNDDGAVFLPGEKFTDAANKIEVEVLTDTGTGYTVRIAKAPRPQ
jgi:M6 family metalloprotease-like protein